MSGIASDPTATLLREIYGPIQSELTQVEDILRLELRSDYPYVDELVRYGCLLGGKRLRPVLLLLSGQAVGNLNRNHLVLAAVVEMIHTATLVHDDILDEADTRRHLATVNSRWDNKASVLLGDYLFTHAFYLASTMESTWACRAIGRATNIVCEGELRQKGNRGDFTLDEQEYLDIIAAKTAELCACSCQLGAHEAGASDEWVDRFSQYGRDLGIAFQIVDDVLDLLGDENATGKSLGTDLEQQKPTLPVIHALQTVDANTKKSLLEIVNRESGHSTSELKQILQRCGAIDYSMSTAQRFSQQALQQLDGLNDNSALQTLKLLPDFVVHRSM